MGYRVETHGQKGFNGVAILSKLPLEDISRGLPGNAEDLQARWIEATIMGQKPVRLCGLYLPNGNPVPGPKYDYKLAWMVRMQKHASTLLALEMPLIMAGDYNIIPQAQDAAKPETWVDDALYLPESRAAFRAIENIGFQDAFRTRQTGPGHYSFWDYQAGAYERNNGVRIDHFLMSAQAMDLLEDCAIDKVVRAGEKPSDHVPVWIKLRA